MASSMDRSMSGMFAWITAASVSLITSAALAQDLVVYADVLYTMAGPDEAAGGDDASRAGRIDDAVVVIRDGRIEAVGPAASVVVPRGITSELRAAVVTPGLIDGRSTVGLTGIYNTPGHDQDQLERSEAMQPQLRAMDAYNPREELVAYLRGFGITTVHTGHAPGELISGQTFVVKTAGETVQAAVVRESAAVAATLSPMSLRGGGSPGTRGKQVAMLREQLFSAQAHRRAVEAWEAKKAKGEATDDDRPARDLKLEAMVRVLKGELPLLVTANRAQDIDSALRLQAEFGFKLWLDSGAEAYLAADRLREAGVPVFVHPTMARPWSDMDNMAWTTAGVLADAGVPVVMQSGFEDYVPKVRVVLYEAAIAAVNGLGFDRALAAITIEPARLLAIDDRVGSIAAGKDGDLALFDGDPFEYTTHCVATVIEGVIVSNTPQ